MRPAIGISGMHLLRSPRRWDDAQLLNSNAEALSKEGNVRCGAIDRSTLLLSLASTRPDQADGHQISGTGRERERMSWLCKAPDVATAKRQDGGKKPSTLCIFAFPHKSRHVLAEGFGKVTGSVVSQPDNCWAARPHLPDSAKMARAFGPYDLLVAILGRVDKKGQFACMALPPISPDALNERKTQRNPRDGGQRCAPMLSTVWPCTYLHASPAPRPLPKPWRAECVQSEGEVSAGKLRLVSARDKRHGPPVVFESRRAGNDARRPQEKEKIPVMRGGTAAQVK
jgi:hypothetical protein